MARPLPLPVWPDGAPAAVSLTFDVDAEAGVTCGSREYGKRLSTLSEARFGVVRGVPRVLELLDEYAIPSTFYVPGETAERHSAVVQTIAEHGHEIGHHGHYHLRSHLIDAGEQREEISLGLAAIERCVGIRPTGYRSPAWELTPETFAVIVEEGFAYDSSCMGDDRPYIEESNGMSLLELPVHWSLDDYPYFGWNPDSGGLLADPSVVADSWVMELDSTLREGRHATYTFHPEVIGRAHRRPILQRLLEAIRARGLWAETHQRVGELVHRSS